MPLYPFKKDRYWHKTSEKALTLKMEAAERSDISKIETVKKSDIRQWFYFPGWTQTQRRPIEHGNVKKYQWIIFLDDLGVGEFLFSELGNLGCTPILVTKSEQKKTFDSVINIPKPYDIEGYMTLFRFVQNQSALPIKIIHLWNLTPLTTNFHDHVLSAAHCLETGFFSLLNIAKAFDSLSENRGVSVLAVTNGAQSIADDDLIFPEKATIQGAIKVIPREIAGIEMKSIDVVLPRIQDLESLIHTLIEESFISTLETQVAYRGMKRWVPHFEEASLPCSDISQIKPKGTYLITGGLSGIGMLLAKHFSKFKEITLILTRKGSFPEKDKWQETREIPNTDIKITEALNDINLMETMGARIHALSCDVTSKQEVLKLKEYLSNNKLTLNGIIHAAGKKPSGFILETPFSAMAEVLNPKIAGNIKPLPYVLITLLLISSSYFLQHPQS